MYSLWKLLSTPKIFLSLKDGTKIFLTVPDYATISILQPAMERSKTVETKPFLSM